MMLQNPGLVKQRVYSGWLVSDQCKSDWKKYLWQWKGFSSKPNPKGPNPTNKKDEVSYQQAIYKKHRSD